MKPEEIPFVDLKEQNRGLSAEIADAAARVLMCASFSGGPFVKRFEEEFAAFLRFSRFAGVSSGSDALFLALKALGIGCGDEVIVPDNTYVATAFAVVRAGARPVFADCDSKTWQIDPVSAEKCITSKTRAVIGVHLYGQAFPVEEMAGLADSYALKMIEDCAQSAGTLYRGEMTGTLCDAGCFSFYPTKNLGACGQAGGVACADEEADALVRLMRAQGETRKYRHDFTGYNMRLDDLQAAILSVKLPHLAKWIERRSEIVSRYHREIHNPLIQFQSDLPHTRPAWHLAVACVDERERFLRFLGDRGIRCGIHYPVPCSLQRAFSDFGYRAGDLPCSLYLAEHCVSLPLYPELDDEKVERVIDACCAYLT